MNLRIRSPRTVRSLLIATVLFTGAIAYSQVSPADSPAAARMRALNNTLLNVHGQMQHADASGARTLRGQAAAVLAQRAAALDNLIQTNPHDALSFAFSPELLADLAAKFPQSASQLESHATVTGPVQHWVADYPGFKKSRSIWIMNLGGRTLNLHFATQEPGNLSGDQLLQATGIIERSHMAVASSVPVQASAGSTLSSLGVQTTSSSHQEPVWPVSLLLIAGFVFAVPQFRWRARVNRDAVRILLQHLGIFALIFTLMIATSIPGYAQASCSATGVQNTLVILVNLPNGALPSGVTLPAMQDIFFATNTPGISLDGFLREASYGQSSAAGQVVGPFNLTGTYTSCSDVGGAVLSDAIAQAQASGVAVNNYSRVFLIFPDIFRCGWQGFASSGCGYTSATGTYYNFSPAFISAAYATPRASGVQLATHEIGHNFGLLHSGNLKPTIASDVIGPLSSPGTETDLGDYWTTMSSSLGLYSAPQNAQTLGWLSSSTNVQTVTASGTYTVQPLEINTSGVQALRIQRGTGNTGYYLWVEYRQPLDNGYDSTLLSSAYNGALIHYEQPGQVGGAAHSYLPNFTPSDTTTFSSPLAAGQTWTDPYSNLSLSVLSATSSGLTISVNYGTTPCTSAAPSINVSPLNPSIYPGQSASYTATITDNDSSGCSSSTINLGSSVPSGWSTSFSSSAVTLNPGQSTSVTMGKGAPPGTAAGTYSVNLSASNASYSASGTANATVIAPPALSISLSASGSSFIPPTTVLITASVLNGGVPASGATVTFTLTAPNNSTTMQTATTSSSGGASWNYKLNGRALPGTYSLVAQAALTSGTKKSASTTQTAASNSLTFTVQ